MKESCPVNRSVSHLVSKRVCIRQACPGEPENMCVTMSRGISNFWGPTGVVRCFAVNHRQLSGLSLTPTIFSGQVSSSTSLFLPRPLFTWFCSYGVLCLLNRLKLSTGLFLIDAVDCSSHSIPKTKQNRLDLATVFTLLENGKTIYTWQGHYIRGVAVMRLMLAVTIV